MIYADKVTLHIFGSRKKVTIPLKPFLNDKYLITIVVLATIMSILYSILLLWKHNNFSTYAWDLGIFAQALKSTLSGKFMYHTPYLFVVPSGNYMEIHFTPLLLLILPFYALAPRPETLLVIKAFVSFMAAIPLYLLSKKITNRPIRAFAIALSYLLYPPLHGSVWFDFQPQSFLPCLVFSSEYAYAYGKMKLWIIFLGLVALSSEQGALLALLILVIKFMQKLAKMKSSTYSSRKELINMVLVLLVFLAYFVTISSYLEYNQINNTTAEFRDFLRAYSNWEVLGYRGNTFLLPLYVIQHPGKAFEALAYDYHIKFLNILITYGTLLFIPLQHIYGIVSLAIQVPFLLSNYRAYYTLGAHYPYYYIPFIFLGLVYAFNNVHNVEEKLYVRGLTLATIIALLSTAPISPLAMKIVEEANILWYPIIRVDIGYTESLQKLINVANTLNRPILVQNHVFPHTTLSENVYAIPLESVFQFNQTATIRYIDELLERSELVLLDMTPRAFDVVSEVVLKRALDRGFGVYAASRSGILLAKGYNDKPLELDDLDHIVLPSTSMIKGVSAIEVNGYYYMQKGKSGYVVYGPYTHLLPGMYEACYNLLVRDPDEGPILMLDVAVDRGSKIIASLIVSGIEVASLGHEEIKSCVRFTVPAPIVKFVEFRVYSYGISEVYFFSVEIRRISPRYDVVLNDFSIPVTKLYLSQEAMVINNMLIANLTNPIDYLWWGPYIYMPAGRYFVRLYLAIDPQPQDSVAIIDIVYNRGTIKLAEVNITKSSLRHLAKSWYVIEIPIEIKKDVPDLEIRCVKTFPGYILKLSHIQIYADSLR